MRNMRHEQRTIFKQCFFYCQDMIYWNRYVKYAGIFHVVSYITYFTSIWLKLTATMTPQHHKTLREQKETSNFNLTFEITPLCTQYIVRGESRGGMRAVSRRKEIFCYKKNLLSFIQKIIFKKAQNLVQNTSQFRLSNECNLHIPRREANERTPRRLARLPECGRGTGSIVFPRQYHFLFSQR